MSTLRRHFTSKADCKLPKIAKSPARHAEPLEHHLLTIATVSSTNGRGLVHHVACQPLAMSQKVYNPV